MDILNEYQIYVIFGLVALVIVLVVLISIIISKVSKISKMSIDSTLKVESKIAYESSTEKNENKASEVLSITIYNNNWRDIVISDFGFEYKGILLSFIDEYSKKNTLKNKNVIVPARSHITLKLNPLRLETFIVENNFSGRSQFEIYDVVIDNVGTKIRTKNSSLTKVLTSRQQARIKLAKKMLHDQRIEQYKREHSDQVPVSEHFYKLFHSKKFTNQHLLNVATTFVGAKLSTDAKDQVYIKDNTTQNKKKLVLPEIDEKVTSKDEPEDINSDKLTITYVNKPSVEKVASKEPKKEEVKETAVEKPNEKSNETPAENTTQPTETIVPSTPKRRTRKKKVSQNEQIL